MNSSCSRFIMDARVKPAHDPERHPDRQMAPSENETNRIPVAIAGGGPVGLMLALFLDLYGVRSVVFNTEPQVRRHPEGLDPQLAHHGAPPPARHRAAGPRSLPADQPADRRQLLHPPHRLGARPHPHAVGGRQAARGRQLRGHRPDPRAAACAPTRCTSRHSCWRTRARAPTSRSASAGRSTSFQEDADGVTVEAESDRRRREETWRAQYLAGCDGGRSFVRRSLALRYHGFASLDSPHYGGRQNATYFRAPTLYRDHLAHRPGWNYWVVNPKGRCTIISLNDDDEFLAFSKAPDDGTPPTDEDVARDDRARRRRRPAGQDHRPLALDRGRRAGGRALRRPAAWCWPATPCICSRRPAASA